MTMLSEMTKSEEKKTGLSLGEGRLLSLDVLRAVAVVLMVEQHMGVWLFSWEYAGGVVARWLIWFNMLGGFAAPLFVVLAGVGVALGKQAGGTLLRRGAVLFLLGVLLNLATPGWFSPESFYILHLLGVWLMVAPSLRWLDGGTLLILCAFTLGVSVLGQLWLETPRALTNQRMSDASLGGGWLRLALFEGHFPVFPWLSFGILGLWAGRAMEEGRLDKLGKMVVGLLGAAIAIFAVSTLSGKYAMARLPDRALWAFSFYPATPLLFASLGGACLLLLYTCLKAEEAGLLRRLRGMRPLGRTSLTLLVVHILLFREGFERLGLRREFTVLQTLSATLSFLVLWSVASEVWSRAGYRYGLEWLLRRVSRPRSDESADAH